MKLKHAFLAVSLLAAAGAIGCKSTHEEGVKSNLHSQYATVNANTQVATSAAEAVLRGDGLQEVSSNATMFDGKASGKMADGTKINVTVKKKTDATSEVTVNVGTLGSPTYGTEIVRKIKDRTNTP